MSLVLDPAELPTACTSDQPINEQDCIFLYSRGYSAMINHGRMPLLRRPRLCIAGMIDYLPYYRASGITFLKGKPTMAFELPDLPYSYDALEPYMSSTTLHLHHDKHHQTYVTNLNNLVPDTEFEGKSLEEIIAASSGGVFNNAAQIWNHTFYWNSLSPNGGGAPGGA
ncbi:MAG: hypothetical protein ACR2P3_05000, partial [Geminicoccaceae bacterium]